MYNALVDIAVFGVLLLVMGLVIWWPRKERGATPAEDWQIIQHQKIRRLENDLH